MRVTMQALAAVLGGTQSLHTNSMDEALALPTERAVQIALRTQQILAYDRAWPTPSTPGRFLLHRVSHRRDRTAGGGVHRPDRGDGRGGGDGGRRLHSARNPGTPPIGRNRRSSATKISRRGPERFHVARTADRGLAARGCRAQEAQIACVQAVRASRRHQARAGLPCWHRSSRPPAQPDAALMPLFVEAVQEYATLGEICGRIAASFRRIPGKLATLDGHYD